MAKFLILTMCVALGAAAPSHPVLPLGHLGYAYGGPAHVHEQIVAGPPVAETFVRHGVVGSKTVQVGSRTVQVGHQYVQAGQSVHHPPAFSVVEAPATYSQNTVPLDAPLPAPAPADPIPPAPVNLGPAPLDAVTQERVVAAGRTHAIITPQLTRIEPELQVNKFPVEVPRAVPVPVERTVVHTQHVPKPYNVEVPRPVPVAQPYKVHPIQQIVETPVIHQKTVSVQQPYVHTHVTPLVAAAPLGHFAHDGLAYGLAGAAPVHGVLPYGAPVVPVAEAGIHQVAEAAPVHAPAAAEAVHAAAAAE